MWSDRGVAWDRSEMGAATPEHPAPRARQPPVSKPSARPGGARLRNVIAGLMPARPRRGSRKSGRFSRWIGWRPARSHHLGGARGTLAKRAALCHCRTPSEDRRKKRAIDRAVFNDQNCGHRAGTIERGGRSPAVYAPSSYVDVTRCHRVRAAPNDRPYRQARSCREAVDEIVRHRGTQFDPAVVDVLVQLLGTGQLNRATDAPVLT